MRIALAQINTIVGDLCGNLSKIEDYIHRAQKEDADIIVFPELTITGYPPEDLLLKEHFVQDNLKMLRSLTKKVRNIIVVVGFVDKDVKKNIYNAAAVLADKRLKGIYHKHKLPNYGVFDEKRYFSEGITKPVFILDSTKIGLNICEDLWVEDSIFLQQVQQGTQILINLSASPYDFGKSKYRQQLLKKRAQKSKAYICYTNLIGGQDELVFDGGSMVISPEGKIITSARKFEEDLIFADLDFNVGQKKLTQRKNFIYLHKKDQKCSKKKLLSHKFSNLTQIERVYKALVLGTHDYIRKNGFEKVVLGLSGGIDSSLVAVIAAEAIGKENVIGISMPSQFTSKETKTDACQLAENLAIQFYEIPIHGIFVSYGSIFEKYFQNKKISIAEENLQARIRGNILMTFSNKFGWLVLTTGNKSEVAVGYCTLYGDMTGGFAVIKDVPKTKVYEIARYINEKKGLLIPESVLVRPPTAELRENQKDEDSLPPYDVLDPILKAYVEEHQSLKKICRSSLNQDLVKKIVKLVDRSEYKRRQSPPGIKITPRAFGKDWRLPITNKYNSSDG